MHVVDRTPAALLVTARRVVAVVLVVLAVTWILVNQPVEGPILLVVTPTHGLTVADLPSLAAFAVAVALAWPRSRR